MLVGLWQGGALQTPGGTQTIEQKKFPKTSVYIYMGYLVIIVILGDEDIFLIFNKEKKHLTLASND